MPAGMKKNPILFTIKSAAFSIWDSLTTLQQREINKRSNPMILDGTGIPVIQTMNSPNPKKINMIPN